MDVNNFLTLCNGEVFYHDKPDMDLITFEIIAHSLSKTCRWRGHTSEFYSVAEHSCLVAWEMEKAGFEPPHIMWALLHDAAEAYICDLPSPIKRYLISKGNLELSEMEKRLLRLVATKFELPERVEGVNIVPGYVCEFDWKLLGSELDAMFPEGTREKLPWTLESFESPPSFYLWNHKEAKTVFLNTLRKVHNQLKHWEETYAPGPL